MRHISRTRHGFTLIELVMVITGILAVVAIPRFMDKTSDERGFRDAVKVAVEQKLKGQ